MDAIMSLPTTIAKLTKPHIPQRSFRVEGVDPRCTGVFSQSPRLREVSAHMPCLWPAAISSSHTTSSWFQIS